MIKVFSTKVFFISLLRENIEKTKNIPHYVCCFYSLKKKNSLSLGLWFPWSTSQVMPTDKANTISVNFQWQKEVKKRSILNLTRCFLLCYSGELPDLSLCVWRFQQRKWNWCFQFFRECFLICRTAPSPPTKVWSPVRVNFVLKILRVDGRWTWF